MSKITYEIHFILCYYAHAKLKAVKGKRLWVNTGIVKHLSIVRWNLLKRNINFSNKEERKQADRGIEFYIEHYKNKIRKGPCYNYVVRVCNQLLIIRDQFTFLAKVNIRVKFFSVCSLHLMESSMFVKQTFSINLSATINRVWLYYQHPIKTTPCRNPATTS